MDNNNAKRAKCINYEAEDLYNYEEDNEDEKSYLSSYKYDLTTRLSRFMKGKTSTYTTDEKIHFEIRQIFKSVNHFKEVLKDCMVQRGFALKKIYNEMRRMKLVCTIKGCLFHLYATMMVDEHSYQIRIYKSTHITHTHLSEVVEQPSS